MLDDEDEAETTNSGTVTERYLSAGKESFQIKSPEESYRNFIEINRRTGARSIYPQMKCSDNKLFSERSFVCHDCAKDDSILCINCALACHFLHKIEGIHLEAPDFTCDCGNPRSSEQQICLFSPVKELNCDNMYVFRRWMPATKLTEDDFNRRREFLVKSSHLYVERASTLYYKKYFIEAMSDMNKAISWDEPHISSEICDMARRWAQSTDVTDWLFAASNDFSSAVSQLDYKSIMPSLEVFHKFCKYVRCLYAVMKKKLDKEARERMDNAMTMVFEVAVTDLYSKFHEKAVSFDEIEIYSLLQYDHYMQYVEPKRKCNAKIVLLERGANQNNLRKMLKDTQERGFEVRSRDLWG